MPWRKGWSNVGVRFIEPIDGKEWRSEALRYKSLGVVGMKG